MPQDKEMSMCITRIIANTHPFAEILLSHAEGRLR